jgi:hypothetical protein
VEEGINFWLIDELAHVRDRLVEKEAQLAEERGRNLALQATLDLMFENCEKHLNDYTQAIRDNDRLAARLEKMTAVEDYSDD